MRKLKIWTATLLWWSVFWRSLLLMLCGLVAAVFLVGTVCWLLNASHDATRNIGFIAGILVANLAECISLMLVAEKLLLKLGMGHLPLGGFDAFKLWWSYFWRRMFFTAVPALGVFTLIGVGFWVFGHSEAQPRALGNLVAYYCGIALGIPIVLAGQVISVKLAIGKFVSRVAISPPRL
ncbi:hypothetical protein A7J71_20650 [Achromobacter insolitus]|uniref:hypothetical protein n=1 Tax=Achromobacter insolitus TaxID=217204 RepID=UPI0007C643FD|nr:hypothetical protein [Achromobacter insolitus]OAE71660.1 hypothetical protein A7J71_20650 [Achromobacter insolitus]OCZ52933.1 hypothetical protein A7P22_16200 [Achromobacter insolitus]